MPKILFKLLILFFVFALPLHARAEVALDVRTDGAREMITLSSPSGGPFRVFSLEKPDRLVVDLPLLSSGSGIELPSGYKGKAVRSVRHGRFDAKTSRIVFELSGPASSIKTNIQGDTLTVHFTQGPARAQTVTPAKPKAKTESKPVAKAKPKKKEDVRPVIVIDAGHGGKDPGAIGPRGTQEKDVVLNFARALRTALLATGRYRVHMTRDDDSFIFLRDRFALARENKADMFISLHADSAPEQSARGLSIYTLSEKASDAEAEALAARENKVDAVYGMDLSDQSKDVADILVSLAQRDTNNRSALLAQALVKSFDRANIMLLPNTHRFAGFAVLKAPDVPSVLIETGFISNAEDERKLLDKNYREKVVRAIARGIDGYFASKPKENRS